MAKQKVRSDKVRSKLIQAILADLDGTKLKPGQRVALMRIAAGLIAGRKIKTAKVSVTESVTHPKPAVMLSETEQILAIEAKRNEHGTR